MKVYDVGRYVDSSGNIHEAHQIYRVAQSSHAVLMLPKGTHPSGAKRAKEKLEAAQQQVQKRLNEDNNLRGELQAQIDENERLRAQIEAGMSAKHEQPAQTDAEKAAASAVDPLVQWGKQVQQ